MSNHSKNLLFKTTLLTFNLKSNVLIGNILLTIADIESKNVSDGGVPIHVMKVSWIRLLSWYHSGWSDRRQDRIKLGQISTSLLLPESSSKVVLERYLDTFAITSGNKNVTVYTSDTSLH